MLVDTSSTVAEPWQIIGQPTPFIPDAQGRKALRAIGGREWDHPDLIAGILALES